MRTKFGTYLSNCLFPQYCINNIVGIAITMGQQYRKEGMNHSKKITKNEAKEIKEIFPIIANVQGR